MIDIGPGSGEEGDDVVARGTPEQIIEAGDRALTGQAPCNIAGSSSRSPKKKAGARKNR